MRVPGWATVIALAEALGVPTDSFKQKPRTEAPDIKPMGRPRKNPALAEEEPPPAKLGRPKKAEAPPAEAPAPTPARRPRAKKGGG